MLRVSAGAIARSYFQRPSHTSGPKDVATASQASDSRATDKPSTRDADRTGRPAALEMPATAPPFQPRRFDSATVNPDILQADFQSERIAIRWDSRRFGGALQLDTSQFHFSFRNTEALQQPDEVISAPQSPETESPDDAAPPDASTPPANAPASGGASAPTDLVSYFQGDGEDSLKGRLMSIAETAFGLDMSDQEVSRLKASLTYTHSTLDVTGAEESIHASQERLEGRFRMVLDGTPTMAGAEDDGAGVGRGHYRMKVSGEQLVGMVGAEGDAAALSELSFSMHVHVKGDKTVVDVRLASMETSLERTPTERDEAAPEEPSDPVEGPSSPPPGAVGHPAPSPIPAPSVPVAPPAPDDAEPTVDVSDELDEADEEVPVAGDEEGDDAPTVETDPDDVAVAPTDGDDATEVASDADDSDVGQVDEVDRSDNTPAPASESEDETAEARTTLLAFVRNTMSFLSDSEFQSLQWYETTFAASFAEASTLVEAPSPSDASATSPTDPDGPAVHESTDATAEVASDVAPDTGDATSDPPSAAPATDPATVSAPAPREPQPTDNNGSLLVLPPTLEGLGFAFETSFSGRWGSRRAGFEFEWSTSVQSYRWNAGPRPHRATAADEPEPASDRLAATALTAPERFDAEA